MAGKSQPLTLAVLISVLLVKGCAPAGGPKAGGPVVGRVPQSETEQRKAQLTKQLERKFENPQAHFQLGQLYQAEQRWDQAEYHYKIAISFDPVHWPAQAALVKVLDERGSKEKSKAAAEIYMNQVATSADRSLQLGIAFRKEQLNQYALACLQQGLSLNPKSASILKELGYYYLGQSNQQLAKEYFIRSFDIDRMQPDVAFELGRMDVLIEVQRKGVTSTKTPSQPPSSSDKETKK